MSCTFLVGILVAVDDTIDTASTNCRCKDTLSLVACPATRFLPAAEGLSGASDQGSFDCLLDFLLLIDWGSSTSA